MEVNYSKIINKDRLLGWRFAPMPDIVRRSPVLSDGAKILYNEIVSYIWQKSDVKAWPSQDALGINLGISRQCIGRRLGELESVGLIGVSRRGLGQSNELYIYEPDPVRLQVIDDGHGSFRPALKSQSVQGVAELSIKKEASNPVVATDVTKPLHQDVTQTLHQDVTSMIKVEACPQVDSLDIARVSVIDVGGESESCINKKREEEAGPHTPQFSNSTIDRKETVVKTPKTKIDGSDKSQKENLTQPDSILYSQVPKDYRIMYNIQGEPLKAIWEGKAYSIIDDRKIPKIGTSPSAVSSDIPSNLADVPKEPMLSDVSLLAATPSVLEIPQHQTAFDVGQSASDTPLEIQSDNSNEVDVNLSAQLADGIDDYDSPDCCCPFCEAPVFYERGRVRCNNCDWEFGYRKFKERFLAQREYDISISPQAAAQNRLNLNLLLSDVPSKKSEGEKLLGDLNEVMSETRVVKPSGKLFGDAPSVECPIDASMEKKNEGEHGNGSGNGGKRSKEEILRRLKMLDLASGVGGEI